MQVQVQALEPVQAVLAPVPAFALAPVSAPVLEPVLALEPVPVLVLVPVPVPALALALEPVPVPALALVLAPVLALEPVGLLRYQTSRPMRRTSLEAMSACR